jgi:DNA-binding MarR family transcriptional regulator
MFKIQKGTDRGQTGDRQTSGKSIYIILTEKQHQILELLINNSSILRSEIATAIDK